jgi:hypothetical protein
MCPASIIHKYHYTLTSGTLSYISHTSIITEFYLMIRTFVMLDLLYWCSLLFQRPLHQYFLHTTITTVIEKFKFKVREQLLWKTCLQIKGSLKPQENGQVLKQPINLQNIEVLYNSNFASSTIFVSVEVDSSLPLMFTCFKLWKEL